MSVVAQAAPSDGGMLPSLTGGARSPAGQSARAVTLQPLTAPAAALASLGSEEDLKATFAAAEQRRGRPAVEKLPDKLLEKFRPSSSSSSNMEGKGNGGGDYSSDVAATAAREKDRRKKEKKSKKKRLKTEIAQMVSSTLAEIMAALATEKGAQILHLAARVRAVNNRMNGTANSDGDGAAGSAAGGMLPVKLKRQDAGLSLGLTFHTPGRIQSRDIGWEMDQYLVVTEVGERDGVKHGLQTQDVVVAVDNVDVHTIQDLQRAVTGKRKCAFTVIRDDADEAEITAAMNELHDNIRSSVKSKVKMRFKAQRRHTRNVSNSSISSMGSLSEDSND